MFVHCGEKRKTVVLKFDVQQYVLVSLIQLVIFDKM